MAAAASHSKAAECVGEYAVRAAEAGIHVLCEKPMALTAHECEKMIHAAETANVKLMIAESNNFPDLAQFYREEVIERGTRMIDGLLQRGIARGELRPVDVTIHTQLLMAPVLMLMLWKHSIGPCELQDLDSQAFLQGLIDMALNGLQTR